MTRGIQPARSTTHLAIELDREADARLFEQIREQFANHIRRGRFQPHDVLPSASQLANDLGVNHLTVRKAFDGLVKEGLVYRVQGKGTFVSDAAGKPIVGIVCHLNRQPQAYSQEVHAVMAERLISLIEADGCAHQTLLLTTPRRDMHAENWNDHDQKILEEADLRAVYLVNPGVPTWFIERCQRDGVPVVSLNGYRQDTHEVMFADQGDMVDLAGRYLREQGRRQPAIVFLDSEIHGNRESARRLGERLRDSGGFTDKIPVIGVRQASAYNGQAATARLLRNTPGIDSIVCLDDVLNMGVCWAAVSMGFDSPEKLLLVSHANKGLTPPFASPVTRIECDCIAGVELAHKLASQSLAGDTTGQVVKRVRPRLVPEEMIRKEQVEMYAEAV